MTHRRPVRERLLASMMVLGITLCGCRSEEGPSQGDVRAWPQEPQLFHPSGGELLIADESAKSRADHPVMKGLQHSSSTDDGLAPHVASHPMSASRIPSTVNRETSKAIQTASAGDNQSMVRFADAVTVSSSHDPGQFADDPLANPPPISLNLILKNERRPVDLPWAVTKALTVIKFVEETPHKQNPSSLAGNAAIRTTLPIAETAKTVAVNQTFTKPKVETRSNAKTETTPVAVPQNVAIKTAVIDEIPVAAATTPDREMLPKKRDPGIDDSADPIPLPTHARDTQSAGDVPINDTPAVVQAAVNEATVTDEPRLPMSDIEQSQPLRTARHPRGGIKLAAKTVIQPELITLHLDNVDVRQVLEMLSREHGLNILVAPGVSGLVTANLEAVDKDEALSAILRLCNLVANREGNLTFVYSSSEVPTANSTVRIFPLDYSKAVDILPAVEQLLSPAGQAFSSESNETDNRKVKEVIVVIDNSQVQRRIAQYVAEIDYPPAQVLIEAHVLAVELEKGCEFGINYERLFSLGNTDVEFRVTGFADDTDSPGVFAHLSGSDVDTLLEFLKTTNDAKVLASPRVMVINEQKARIQIGEQLGYKVVTVTEVAAVEEVKFLDVGVVLEVTPRITRDRRVLMRVRPKVSSGLINPDTLLPEEDTTEVETNVFLENGEAVVIGGLIQEKDTESVDIIPILGELRYVGKLFRHTVIEKERREIIVTLVPRIVEPVGRQEIRDVINVEQSVTPLFEGALQSHPRPWEPKLPVGIGLLPGHCGGRFCRQDNCHCRCHNCQHITPATNAGFQGVENLPAEHPVRDRLVPGAEQVPLN